MCRLAIGLAVFEVCPRCATGYHKDCLTYAGRCAVFGCDPGPALQIKKPAPSTRNRSATILGLILAFALPSGYLGNNRPKPSVLPTRSQPSPDVAAPPPASPKQSAGSEIRPARAQPALECPTFSRFQYDTRWTKWSRAVLDKTVLSDPGVMRETRILLRDRGRKLFGICYEISGERLPEYIRLTAYICFGDPKDEVCTCIERIVVVLQANRDGQTPPTVDHVESTAATGRGVTRLDPAPAMGGSLPSRNQIRPVPDRRFIPILEAPKRMLYRMER